MLPSYLKRHSHFTTNTLGRDFVMGDLHGATDSLQQALVKVRFDRDRDRLFSVGDLIDRGPHSLAALDLLAEPWFHCCLGNHELMMLQACENRDPAQLRQWLINGGGWAITDGGELSDQALDRFTLMTEHLHTTMTIETEEGTTGIVHAEPPEDWSQRQNTAIDHLVWSRQLARLAMLGQTASHPPIHHVDRVYCGHTILDAPHQIGNVHFIDTGAYRPGGHLTVIPLNG